MKYHVLPGHQVTLAEVTPHGERGLKSDDRPGCPVEMRRSPYGERGLKYRGIPRARAEYVAPQAGSVD